MSDDRDDPDLGSCCICGGADRVHAIVTLELKNQVPGHGWGCFVCRLPMDGASAVLCDDCCTGWQNGQVELQWACRGYPATDGRVPIGELTEPHTHDPAVEH